MVGLFGPFFRSLLVPLEEFNDIHYGDDCHEDEEEDERFSDDRLFPFFGELFVAETTEENHEPAAAVEGGDWEDVHTGERDGDDCHKEEDESGASRDEIREITTDYADDARNAFGGFGDLLFAFFADGSVGRDLASGAGDEIDDELSETAESFAGKLDGEAGSDDGSRPSVAVSYRGAGHGDAEQVLRVGGVKSGFDSAVG